MKKLSAMLVAVLLMAGSRPAFAEPSAPNLGIPPMGGHVARTSAWWDIGLGAGIAVLGAVGLTAGGSADKASKNSMASARTFRSSAGAYRADADDHVSNGIGYSYWAGKWEGWGDAMEIDYGAGSSFTLNARYYQGLNESSLAAESDAYDSDIASAKAAETSASAAEKIAQDKAREAGLWTGVGYVGLGVGVVLIVKGLITLSKVAATDGRISGTPLRIETVAYPETRLALAYDF